MKQFESPIELMEIGHRIGVTSNCDRKKHGSSFHVGEKCVSRGLDRVCSYFVQEAKRAKGAEKRGRDSSQFR